MNRKLINRGFTLIEILAAMAMVAVVFAMVYGANSAITRSVRAYNARRDLVLPAKKAIEQMARQIRCAYAPPADNSEGQTATETKNGIYQSPITNNQSPKGFAYFSSSWNDKTGGVLHLVTTNGCSLSHNAQEGIFDVAYKFDRASGTLFYHQRQFAPVGEDLNENWSDEGRIAEGIDRITLMFFDGKTWQQNWDWYDQKQRLPVAVSIEIIIKGEHNFQYRYETVAFARSAQIPPAESRQLASARKQ